MKKIIFRKLLSDCLVFSLVALFGISSIITLNSNLINEISKITGIKYGNDIESDIAFRVIADHVRAVSFCIADGQIPGNNGSSYVIRRILRRAIRYGYTFLNQSTPFIYNLVEILSKQFKGHFDEIFNQKKLIESIIHEEEKSFLRTLASGIERLKNLILNQFQVKKFLSYLTLMVFHQI